MRIDTEFTGRTPTPLAQGTAAGPGTTAAPGTAADAVPVGTEARPPSAADPAASAVIVTQREAEPRHRPSIGTSVHRRFPPPLAAVIAAVIAAVVAYFVVR